MFTTPASIAIKCLLLLTGLLTVGLLLFAPREAAAQTPNASTVGNSVTVKVETSPVNNTVEFDFRLTYEEGLDPGRFSIEDGADNYTIFDELDGGTYVLSWVEEDGWRIKSLSCNNATRADRYIEDGTVTQLFDNDGDHLYCVYTFERVEPTATPSPTATATQVLPTATHTLVPSATQAPPASTATPIVIVVTTVPQTPITPPSVGDGGLLP